MDDKEFRDNCKVFANDVIGFYSDWRKSLTEPEHWLDTMEDTSQLATAALLYIAANMPNLNDKEDKTLCVRDDASHVEGCVDISNCPMCGRKL